MRQRRRFDFSQLRITRGALILAALEIGFSLVWLLSNPSARQTIQDYAAATPDNVWHHWRLWTLVTGVFLDNKFVTLLLNTMMLWTFVPTLERFWGTKGFYRFAAATSIMGTLAGTLVGLATGRDVPIVGISPFIYGSIVAYGIIYARQQVQFFGVLPLTGRQLMFGFLGFLTLYVLLQGAWEEGAAFAAAMGAAALMSTKWSPVMAYRRWKARRARAQLTVLQGGQSGPFAAKKKPKDTENWLN